MMRKILFGIAAGLVLASAGVRADDNDAADVKVAADKAKVEADIKTVNADKSCTATFTLNAVLQFSKAKFAEMVASKQEPHASQFKLLKGSPLNLRVAGSGDAGLAKTMINMLPKPKIKAASPFEEAQW